MPLRRCHAFIVCCCCFISQQQRYALLLRRCYASALMPCRFAAMPLRRAIIAAALLPPCHYADADAAHYIHHDDTLMMRHAATSRDYMALHATTVVTRQIRRHALVIENAMAPAWRATTGHVDTTSYRRHVDMLLRAATLLIARVGFLLLAVVTHARYTLLDTAIDYVCYTRIRRHNKWRLLSWHHEWTLRDMPL